MGRVLVATAPQVNHTDCALSGSCVARHGIAALRELGPVVGGLRRRACPILRVPPRDLADLPTSFGGQEDNATQWCFRHISVLPSMSIVR